MKNITFIGLGAMGSRMAKRLLSNGQFSLTVYNRNTKKADELVKLGARLATTLSQALESADIVISMVTDDKVSKEIWLDGKSPSIKFLKPNALIIESSTLSPEWVKDLSLKIKNIGARFLEAPVAGSLPQAESGQLIYFIGGEPADLESASEVLKALSLAIHHVGPVGHAATFKLIVNGYFLSQIATLSEVFKIAKAADLDVQQTSDIFQNLPATSPALKGILQLVASQSEEVRFSVDLVEKDLRYLNEVALSKKVDAKVLKAAHEQFLLAIQKGLGQKNASSIVS